MKHISGPAIERDGWIVPGASDNGLALAAAPHKWRDLIAPLKLCAKRFELNGTDLHFLETLMSFVEDEHLTLDGNGRLIVFASNRAIAHRMGIYGDSTVNRCIRRSEERGFILRVMSANKKRYRRVGEGGETLRAYGIDLGPLVAGHQRLREISAEVKTEAAQVEALRFDCSDELTRLRSVFTELSNNTQKNVGELSALMKEFARLLRRVPTIERLTDLLTNIRNAISLWTTSLKPTAEPPNLSASAAQSERHIDQTLQNSIDEEREDEKLSEHEIATALPTLTAILAEKQGAREIIDTLDHTAMLLPNSKRAWSFAVSSMGPMQAALILGYVIERGNEITNPGGYIHRLVDQWGRGAIDLTALVRSLTKKKRLLRFQ